MTTIPAQPTRVEVALEWDVSALTPADTAVHVARALSDAGLAPHLGDGVPYVELFSPPPGGDGQSSNQRVQITTVVNPSSPRDVHEFNGAMGRALVASGASQSADAITTALDQGLSSINPLSSFWRAVTTVVPPPSSGVVYLGPMGPPGPASAIPGVGWVSTGAAPYPAALFAPNTDGTPAGGGTSPHPLAPTGGAVPMDGVAGLVAVGAVVGAVAFVALSRGNVRRRKGIAP